MDTSSQMIFHYTSVESFFQIVKSKSILGSLHSSLNDSQETTWFSFVLERRVQKSIAETPKNEKILGELLRQFRQNHRQYFVASFSREPDVLSQWRAYGEDGAGVSVGFFRDRFADTLAGVPVFTIDQSKSRGVFDIEYSENEHNRLADELIRATVLANDVLMPDSYHDLILRVKNPKFQEENETRIVEIQNYKTEFQSNEERTFYSEKAKSLLYRPNRIGDIVPYTAFKFEANAIGSLWLGPKCKAKKKHIELFLLSNDVTLRENLQNSAATYQ